MPFKIHLLIVSLIILVVFGIWRWMESNPQPLPAAPAAADSSAYSVAILHASWGLNCRGLVPSSSDNADPFAGQGSASNRLRDDNVLVKVSELCNGKLKCDIPVNLATLGEDPQPECSEKVLEVEYRCFSFDRPWSARASTGTLKIDCDKTSR